MGYSGTILIPRSPHGQVTKVMADYSAIICHLDQNKFHYHTFTINLKNLSRLSSIIFPMMHMEDISNKLVAH
jgi:hypothetical protein